MRVCLCLLLLCLVPSAFAADLPARIKHYSCDIVIDPDGLDTTLVHIEKTADTDEAARGIASAVITYAEDAETLEILLAETVKTDGRHEAVESTAIVTQSQLQSEQLPYFSGLKQKLLYFPDVSAGDTVSYTFRRRQLKSELPGHYTDYVYFLKTEPIDDARVTYDAPNSLGLSIVASGISLERKSVGNRTHWRLTYQNPKGAVEDLAAVAPIDRIPRALRGPMDRLFPVRRR